MIGTLIPAIPSTSCSPLAPFFHNNDLNDEPGNFFVMSDRGDCSFVKKSFYTQLIGGKMAVLVDNREENLGEIIMVDDGLGKKGEEGELN